MKWEASRPQGGASGRCRYDHRVGFPPRLKGGASSRLARERSGSGVSGESSLAGRNHGGRRKHGNPNGAVTGD